MEQDILPDADRVRSKKISLPSAATGLSAVLRAGETDAAGLPITQKVPAETRIAVKQSLRLILMGNCRDQAKPGSCRLLSSIICEDIRPERCQAILCGVTQKFMDAVDFFQ